LGPEGGENGQLLLGTPEQIMKDKNLLQDII
jgi:hypothetical protein